MAACSYSDNEGDAPPEGNTLSVAINVRLKAELDVARQSRTQVSGDDTSGRLLYFTQGDRLCIVGDLQEHGYRMGGMLSLSDGVGEMLGTFEGELTVWRGEGFDWEIDSSYELKHPANPMLEYGSNTVTGYLIPRDEAEGAFEYDDLKNIIMDYRMSLVSGTDELTGKLMQSALRVLGPYSTQTQCFNLTCDDPIFNCTVSSLRPNTTYKVLIGQYVDEEEYDFIKKKGDIGRRMVYIPPVTTDAEGVARFALSWNNTNAGYWAIWLDVQGKFMPAALEMYEAVIGMREDNLETVVYNIVSKAAVVVAE